MDHGLDIETAGPRRPAPAGQGPQIPLLATNDSHYVMREDAPSQEHLLCINSGSHDGHPGRRRPGQRFKFDGDGYYIKSAARDARAVGDKYDLPEACDNTLLIAERCDVAFTEGNGTFMPRFPCPEGETEDSWLVKEVEKGLQLRYPDGIPDDVRKQADFEVGVITADGLPAATSSSSPTSSTGPRTTASGSARAVAPAPARWSPTPCGSPTSTRWCTA